MRLKKIIFLLFLPISLFAQTQNIVLPATWAFHQLHEPIWLPAQVPGTFHTDLLRNRKIQAPFFQDNEKVLQALEHQIVEYEGKFEITEKQLSAREIQLIFEGLDTYSQVKLNGKEILHSNNMFCTYPVQVKKWLQAGENTLLIRFYPAADSGKILAKKNPYVLPEKERIYTRKAQYQYGWDWGPRFVTCGIWRPIYLTCAWAETLDEVHFVQDSLSTSLANMRAEITLFSDTTATRKIEISDLSNQFLLQKEINITKGINHISIPFSIEKPHLWFPNGYGEPYLYHFNIKVLKDKQVADIKSIDWGFRKIEVIQEKDEKEWQNLT